MFYIVLSPSSLLKGTGDTWWSGWTHLDCRCLLQKDRGSINHDLRFWPARDVLQYASFTSRLNAACSEFSVSCIVLIASSSLLTDCIYFFARFCPQFFSTHFTFDVFAFQGCLGSGNPSWCQGIWLLCNPCCSALPFRAECSSDATWVGAEVEDIAPCPALDVAALCQNWGRQKTQSGKKL